MLSFFEVIRNKDFFIELQLPKSMKIHNVFYSSLLQKASIDSLTNQDNKLPYLIIINNEQK